MSGNLEAGYDLPLEWVNGVNQMVLTNDLANVNTQEFDPHYMVRLFRNLPPPPSSDFLMLVQPVEDEVLTDQLSSMVLPIKTTFAGRR